MNAAPARSARSSAHLAGSSSGSSGSGPTSRVVAEVAVAQSVTRAALLLHTAFAFDGVIYVGRTAETVGCGLVGDFKIEKNEDAAVLNRVASILRDADEAVLLELAGLDHGSLLRGKHSLGIVNTIRENDTVSVADVGCGSSAGLDLFDAENLADGVLNRACGIGRLDHLGDSALRKVTERHVEGLVVMLWWWSYPKQV